MAPKKTAEVVPAAPVVDSNPFGAFINVKVNSGELHLVVSLSFIDAIVALEGLTTPICLLSGEGEAHQHTSCPLILQ